MLQVSSCCECARDFVMHSDVSGKRKILTLTVILLPYDPPNTKAKLAASLGKTIPTSDYQSHTLH